MDNNVSTESGSFPDEVIKRNVWEALNDSRNIDPSEIKVDVKGGVVTLDGLVENREQKFEVEECIEVVPGVSEVHNHLRYQRLDRLPGERAMDLI